MVVPTLMEVKECVKRFEKDFSSLSLIYNVNNNSFVQNGSWYIDNGASRHMTRIWHIFHIISENGPEQIFQLEGGHACTLREFGNVRFQLCHGGYIE